MSVEASVQEHFQLGGRGAEHSQQEDDALRVQQKEAVCHQSPHGRAITRTLQPIKCLLI